MADILITLFTLILLLVSLFLILIILMQKASANAGMGAALGGGVAESTFGADTVNVLTKGTIYAAIAFFVICLGLYLGYMASLDQAENSGAALPELQTENASATVFDDEESDSIIVNEALFNDDASISSPSSDSQSTYESEVSEGEKGEKP